MCEANVYMLNENGEEKLLLEAVDSIVPEDSNLIMVNIYGQRLIIKAKIKEMQLVDHRIILQR